ncbi:Uncharacterized protein TCM_010377 [Theobroma cacao]|uniref:Uncharacterized protein n=1 Tax=Theobroma cacao TaxID=3641 RepID=A0A061E691_THECC|nr:Uncharacterized protein TCM_010377 [Theobroma cacao]
MAYQLCIIGFQYNDALVVVGKILKYVNGLVEDLTFDPNKEILGVDEGLLIFVNVVGDGFSPSNKRDEDEGNLNEYYDSYEFGDIVIDEEDMVDYATRKRDRDLRGNVEDFVSSWYHKDVYMVAYGNALQPMHDI